MTLHQKLAWGYATVFLVVVLLSHWPGLTDQEGYLFGQFHIDPVDDAVHMLSFLWAALAAWRSESASRWYFRIFGAYYTADALLGLFTGWAVPEFLVNFSIAPGYEPLAVLANLPPNIPHFILGPSALFIGFLLPGTQPSTQSATPPDALSASRPATR